MSRWSARLPTEALAAAVPLTLGLAFGNALLLAVGLIPLFYVVLASMFSGPRGVSLETGDGPPRSWVGEKITLGRHVSVEEGMGLVVVGEKVPDHFAPAEGKNLRVHWKGRGKLDSEDDYSVIGRRRGAYEFGTATAEFVHFSGLRTTDNETAGSMRELLVRQKPLTIKGVRDARSLTRTPMPVNAACRLGTRSTDFRELRRYVRGDRFRDINWKATVRLAVDEDTPPLVNEYEREGRRTVWVFLDSARSMRTGTSVENAFESGVAAASAVSRYFLERECEVGFALVGTNRAVLASEGKRQALMIERMLQQAEPEADEGRFMQSVSRLEGHIAGTSPLVILITRIVPENAENIVQGLGRLKAIGGTGLALTVLNVDAFGLAAEDEEDRLAGDLLNVKNRSAVRDVRGAGAAVFDWDPSTQALGRVAVRMLTRR